MSEYTMIGTVESLTLVEGNRYGVGPTVPIGAKITVRSKHAFKIGAEEWKEETISSTVFVPMFLVPRISVGQEVVVATNVNARSWLGDPGDKYPTSIDEDEIDAHFENRYDMTDGDG